MKIQEAFRVFGLSEGSSKDQILAKYKTLAKKYHPDLGGSEEMMKILNDAMDALRSYNGSGHTASFTEEDLGEVLNEVINAIKTIEGIQIEICGTWIWVSGNTYPHKEILKQKGFKFSGKKRMWYFAASQDSTSRRFRGSTSIESIRNTYGSKTVRIDSRIAIG